MMCKKLHLSDRLLSTNCIDQTKELGKGKGEVVGGQICRIFIKLGGGEEIDGNSTDCQLY